jgi:hypothetical protein
MSAWKKNLMQDSLNIRRLALAAYDEGWPLGKFTAEVLRTVKGDPIRALQFSLREKAEDIYGECSYEYGSIKSSVIKNNLSILCMLVMGDEHEMAEVIARVN